MCGIYGSVGQNRNEFLEQFNLAGASLEHRGPDESGSFVSEHANLGIKRLAIVDVQNGHQPYTNERGDIRVVFNGQIYNYVKLRVGLEAKGHKLNSQSDGEIIAHLFEEYGPEFIKLLEGMFAIALWEGQSQSLYLFRDRFGKKPLLYSQDRFGNLHFASEMKALRKLMPKDFSLELSSSSLSDYLAYGYVPNPASIFEEVLRLPPATYLTFNSQKIALTNYWTVKVQLNNNSIEENEKKFDFLFSNAIAKRLTGERTIGAFLSGGIDSSLVVAFLSKMILDPVETFSVSFDEMKFDESRYAKLVSTLYKTNHHELVLSNSNILPYFLEMFDFYDEPFADSSSLATFALCKYASNDIVVALSGDGGDEGFGGYDRYRIFERKETLTSLAYHLKFIDRQFPQLGELIPPRYLRAIRNLPSDRNEFSIYSSLMQLSDASTRLKLLGDSYRESPNVSMGSQFMGDKLARYLQANLSDIQHYLPDDLLFKVDIASMASSLEVRSPFLDHELFEFGISLPQSQRIGKTGKVLLHSVAGKVLPSEVVYRKKMGFGIPRVKWLKGSLNALVQESLLSRESMLASMMNYQELGLIYKEFDSGKPNDAIVWNLLSLEMWARKWLN